MKFRVVINHLVVNLVCHDDQLAGGGDLCNLGEDLDIVDGPGRIVRVDHDNRARPLGDQRAHMLQVRQESVVGRATIVARYPAIQRDRGRPQGIIRTRYEDFITRVE